MKPWTDHHPGGFSPTAQGKETFHRDMIRIGFEDGVKKIQRFTAITTKK